MTISPKRALRVARAFSWRALSAGVLAACSKPMMLSAGDSSSIDADGHAGGGFKGDGELGVAVLVGLVPSLLGAEGLRAESEA
jgi:hypothetical protein